MDMALKEFFRKDNLVYLFDEKGNIFVQKGKKGYLLSVFDRHLYKLRLVNGVPILEIDGLRMHQVKNFKTPLDYSKRLVELLKINRNDVVLDTCAGLGYTTIASARVAKRVIAFEIDRRVIRLARWNPWSAELFSRRNISLKIGDVCKELSKIKRETFSVVIHDPPRFSRAPELYSKTFYLKLLRVSKEGARLFHYVGSFGRKKRSIAAEVKRRLRERGFVHLKYVERFQAVIFKKPHPRITV